MKAPTRTPHAVLKHHDAPQAPKPKPEAEPEPDEPVVEPEPVPDPIAKKSDGSSPTAEHVVLANGDVAEVLQQEPSLHDMRETFLPGTIYLAVRPVPEDAG